MNCPRHGGTSTSRDYDCIGCVRDQLTSRTTQLASLQDKYNAKCDEVRAETARLDWLAEEHVTEWLGDGLWEADDGRQLMTPQLLRWRIDKARQSGSVEIGERGEVGER